MSDTTPKFATQEDLESAAKVVLEENKDLMQDLAKQEEVDKRVAETIAATHENTESTAEEKKVLPELVFNNLSGRLFAHSNELSRAQAVQVLRHAILFPLEHERLPKLKGKHAKLTFQIAVRMFDAKLLMFYNYMKQAETSTVEDVDKLIAQLTDKRAALVEMETKEKKPEEQNG